MMKTPLHQLNFFLLFTCLIFISSSSSSSISFDQRILDHQKLSLGEKKLGGLWTKGDLSLGGEAPSPAPPQTLVLAEKRTNRPDVLFGFRRYRDGWDIRNPHYWASVGFTGSAGFILAALWFVSFGLALIVHHCCKCKISMKDEGSNNPHRICLIFLLLLTCAAAVGCILLSVGQDEFHGEVLHTLNYVVHQSEFVVQTLRNVTEYLSLAKTIYVDQFFLPSDIKEEIDKLNVDLNTAANTLAEKTSENSSRIRKVFGAVRSSLITMAAVMLLLALLGLLLSMLGHQHAIYIFIWSGWLLVAVTLILCGVFLILNNAISDTCVAMGEWVENPHAETTLSEILPCVDQRTTNKTLIQSKEVISQLVNVVNTAIWSFANWDPTPKDIAYYNQSGPLLPPLCSPFDSQMRDRMCTPQEVTFSNASVIWQNYTCTVSVSGLCTSVGRITPGMYSQLVAAVNASYALDHYTPPLLSLQDCNFVRETFHHITTEYCPPAERYLKMVNAGLVLISVGIMLCLILWLVYANRPQREEVFVRNLSIPIKALWNCTGKRSNSTRNNSSNTNNNTTSSNGVEV